MVQSLQDYLHKKTVISREIVTYRILSREFSIHVNEAKKELERFYLANLNGPTQVHATYVLSGVTVTLPQDPGTPSIGSEHSGNVPTSSSRPTSLAPSSVILIVREENLEKIKCQFSRISAIHLYSISPSPLIDPALLTTTSATVRNKDDASRNPDYAKLIGTTLNPYWDEKIKGKVTTHTVPVKPGPKAAPKLPGPGPVTGLVTKVVEGTSSKLPRVEEKRRAGTLDWGKAKAKAKEEEKKDKKPMKTMDNLKAAIPGTLKDETHEPTTSALTKPKPSASSKAPEIEEEASTSVKPSSRTSAPSTTATVPNGRIRKRIFLSDEEDEDSEPPKVSTAKTKDSPLKKRKSTAPETSDDGSMGGVSKKLKSSRLMVTSDEDGDIGMIAKNKQEGSSNGGSESSEPEHTPLSTSELRRKMRDPRLKGGQKQKDEDYGIDAAAAKAKQERAKGARKKGPKGRRKVQKTRTYKDAKGRTVTEDYSSFESASEVEDGKGSIEAGSSRKSSSRGKAKPSGREESESDRNPPTTTKASMIEDRKPSTSSASKKGPSVASSKSASTVDKSRKSGQQTLAGFFKK